MLLTQRGRAAKNKDQCLGTVLTYEEKEMVRRVKCSAKQEVWSPPACSCSSVYRLNSPTEVLLLGSSSHFVVYRRGVCSSTFAVFIKAKSSVFQGDFSPSRYGL